MNIHFLTNTMLFRGMSDEEIKAMLGCLGATEKQFPKGAVIYNAGEQVADMGLILSGSVNIVIDDLWGNSSILSHAGPGQLFAETYACIPGQPLMVSVTAGENSWILFLNAMKLLTTCKNACPYHNRAIQNLLQIAAMKNLALSERSVHTTAKTIRGRLMSYFSAQVKRAGSSSFTIPFDRQQLADYLGVDRSAMSNELSKMRREGLLTCEKNHFSLKK